MPTSWLCELHHLEPYCALPIELCCGNLEDRVRPVLFWSRIFLAAALSSVERVLARAAVLVSAFAAVGAVVVLGGSVISRPLVSMREGRVDRRWAATLSALSTVPQREVPRAATPAALEIEGLAAELGIELAPADLDERTRPAARELARWRDVRGHFRGHTALLVANDGSVPRPDLDMEFFLREHRSTLERLVEVASHGIPPRWEVELERGRDAPQPSLSGLRDLQSVLAGLLASRWNRGEVDDAETILEAAWRLNRSSLERPEMESYLAGLGVLSEHLALVRSLQAPSETWLEALAKVDLEERFLELVQVDSWRLKGRVDRGDVTVPASGWEHVVDNWLGRPILRLAALDHAEAMCWAVEELPQRVMSGFERGAFDADLVETIPRWNLLARREIPLLGASWQRCERAVAELELSVFLLTVRALDATGNRRRIDDLIGDRPSQVEGLSWRIAARGKSLEITLDGEPDPRADGVARLPLRAVVALNTPPTSTGGPDARS